MQDYAKERRRNYFIDRSFQTRFIIKFCLLVIIASLVIGIFTYFFNKQTTTAAFENLRVVVKSTADFILPTVSAILIIVTVLVSIATIIIALFTSHKIAGPLYKVTMEIEKIKRGDFSSDIRVRAKDQMKQLVFEFNQMRISTKDSIAVLKGDWAAIKADLTKLLASVKDNGERRRIEDAVKRIDSGLGRFKTE